ncbi:hypothetical protein RM780_16860 [Streptomyces sp. DSM 44917]|uniref:PIN domain-containing protein n=1 Tax=Streptomyces boetiae TaxID=3075541 RepID=A0ABU2LBD1_9ACTN|nr:hypothetical protein [Streptomyces sp. DSM 44917]MDT0308617.1 hypothetical protein [Streptomyces sp. DSM 44917]
MSAAPLVYVFDSEALSRAVRGDRTVMALIEEARREGIPVVVTPMTVVEADDGRVQQARWHWIMSRLVIHPLGAEQARSAQQLRRATGMHGHKYVIDTFLAVTALDQPGAVIVFTSDVDDLSKLLADRPLVTVQSI